MRGFQDKTEGRGGRREGQSTERGIRGALYIVYFNSFLRGWRDGYGPGFSMTLSALSALFSPECLCDGSSSSFLCFSSKTLHEVKAFCPPPSVCQVAAASFVVAFWFFLLFFVCCFCCGASFCCNFCDCFCFYGRSYGGGCCFRGATFYL